MATAARSNRRDAYPPCGAKKRQGEGVCTQPAGWGTDHVGTGRCKLHGGKTPTQRKKGERDQAQAALVALGQPVATDPREALADLVCEAAGNVAFFRSELRLHSADEVVDLNTPVNSRGSQMLRCYNEERDRLARVAKLAHEAGIADREVQLAERQAELMVRMFVAALDDPELGLSRGQQEIGRRVLGRHVRALGAGQETHQ